MKYSDRYFLASALLALTPLFCVPTCLGRTAISLGGEVLDKMGAVIVGATVRLIAADRVRETKTDGAGQFSFKDIPQGNYALEASHPGFKSYAGEGDGTTYSGRRVSITLEVATNCDFQLFPEYEERYSRVDLVGSVIEAWEGGKGLSSATAILKFAKTNKTYIQHSKPNGEFEFVGLDPGKYLLKITSADYNDSPEMQLWIARKNTTRLPPVSLFKKGENRLFICQ